MALACSGQFASSISCAFDDSKFLEPTQVYINRLGRVKGRPKYCPGRDICFPKGYRRKK